MGRNVTFLGKRSIHISSCVPRAKCVLRSKTIPARMEHAVHQGRHVEEVDVSGVNKDSGNSSQPSVRWGTRRGKRNLSTKGSGFRGSGPASAAHLQDGGRPEETRPGRSRSSGGGTVRAVAAARLARAAPTAAGTALHAEGGRLPLPGGGGHHLLGHSQGGM